jgi:hypothetical protein
MPMDDTVRVSILTHSGPGCMPNEPMALVVKFPADRNPPAAEQQLPALNLSREGASPLDTRYRKLYEVVFMNSPALISALVYYQVYKKRGAIPSKHPVDSSDPYVGRINVDRIPPPHTAASISWCISKLEELDHSKQSQLFTSLSSESPIGEGHISILTSGCPGSMPEDLMAFVELPIPVASPTAYSSFTKRMQVTTQWRQSKLNNGEMITLTVSTAHLLGNPQWLEATVGEIVRTNDDPPKYQSYTHNGGECKGPEIMIQILIYLLGWSRQEMYQDLAYNAVNDAGKMGRECTLSASSSLILIPFLRISSTRCFYKYLPFN